MFPATRAGIGEGVLLRAVEPLEGIERMKRYRHTARLLDLARGPGRLAEAFRITRKLDGADLCGLASFGWECGRRDGANRREREDRNHQGSASAAAFF